MYRAQEVSEAKAPELHATVRRLAQSARIPMPKVYIIPGDTPNAFATGRNPENAAVAVTEGIVRMLSQDELEGVIAHELAHIKNRDTLTSTIAATVAGVFSMLAYSAMFFRGGRGHPLAALAVVMLGMFGAGLIKAMISRSREYVADAEGARIAGSPHGLTSALLKLESAARRVPMRNPNPAMNNMFIVEPFMGRTLTKLFATHPPTEKRIQTLREGWRANLERRVPAGA